MAISQKPQPQASSAPTQQQESRGKQQLPPAPHDASAAHRPLLANVSDSESESERALVPESARDNSRRSARTGGEQQEGKDAAEEGRALGPTSRDTLIDALLTALAAAYMMTATLYLRNAGSFSDMLAGITCTVSLVGCMLLWGTLVEQHVWFFVVVCLGLWAAIFIVVSTKVFSLKAKTRTSRAPV